MDWGTLGEWAAAIGTVVLLVGTYLMWRRDRQRTERRRELEEASKVNVWYQAPGTPPENSNVWMMIVENLGDRPIYEWKAIVYWHPGGADNDVQMWTMSNDIHGPLPPGARRFEQMGLDHEPTIPDDPTDALDVAMSWHDPATGRWWHRDGGKLRGQADRRPLGT